LDMPRRLVGFDSFEGLEDDYEGHPTWGKGACSINHGWHPICELGERVTPQVTKDLFEACRLDPPEIHCGWFRGASAIKCGSGRQSRLNVGVSCSRTGAAERSHDFLY